jgi:predicted nuclease of restriction endonuclease-like (RecB) superfamily
MSRKSLTIPAGYGIWLASLKKRIAGARQRALLVANEEQIRLYHEIGQEILTRQNKEGWGAKVIQQASTDLQIAFPDMRGFSVRNLLYMRLFAEQCPHLQFVQQSAAQLKSSLKKGQQSAAQLPWFHIVILLTKLSDKTLREWYAIRAIQEGWSRDVLESQIKSQLHRRKGKAITNFSKRLEPTQAGLAQEILKDPYHFDFTGLSEQAHERDIENALVRHITRFLLELGSGFAFVGKQVRLEIEGDEFFIDLLFYHIHLKCYVVVELKAGAFKPEYAGQLNFYLAAVDAQLRTKGEKPTIGLLLCKTKKRLVAEYALSGIDKPIGVAEYQLLRALPKPLDTSLPTIEELETGLLVGLEIENGKLKRESEK